MIVVKFNIILRAMKVFVSIVIGYLFGSIPMGYILGKLKGVDITKEGFRKIGASNVYKVLGVQYAVFVFIFDFAKGILMVLFSTKCLGIPVQTAFLSGIAAICGHNWPIWLKFKGHGRGVATSLGLLFYLLPGVTFKVFIIFVIITLIFRSSAPATPVLFLLMPIAAWLYKKPVWSIYFTLSLLLIFLAARIIGGIESIKKSPAKLRTFLDIIIWDKPIV